MAPSYLQPRRHRSTIQRLLKGLPSPESHAGPWSGPFSTTRPGPSAMRSALALASDSAPICRISLSLRRCVVLPTVPSACLLSPFCNQSITHSATPLVCYVESLLSVLLADCPKAISLACTLLLCPWSLRHKLPVSLLKSRFYLGHPSSLVPPSPWNGSLVTPPELSPTPCRWVTYPCHAFLPGITLLFYLAVINYLIRNTLCSGTPRRQSFLRKEAFELELETDYDLPD